MARLKAANNAITKLTVGITAADTSFTVEDAALFPDAPFRVTIDAEIMQVEAIDKLTNTFSAVQRGIEGTVAAPHNNGAEVANRWTAGYLETLATLEEAQAMATTAESEAKTYADDVAATAETSAKTHATGLIGTLGNLLTTAKDNIVAAINEIFAGLGALETDVATLETDVAAHKADIASKTEFGHVKLSSAVGSTSEDLAATPKAVKTAYDKANEKPFVVGTYTGNRSSSRTISLGFRPSAVYVAAKDGSTLAYSEYKGGLALNSYPVMKDDGKVVSITSSGFTVYYDTTMSICTNDSYSLYNPFRYIAFK